MNNFAIWLYDQGLLNKFCDLLDREQTYEILISEGDPVISENLKRIKSRIKKIWNEYTSTDQEHESFDQAVEGIGELLEDLALRKALGNE